MKYIIALPVLVAVCTAGAIPLDVPRDNSHYVEGVSRYIWMQHGDGELRLVDLQDTVDPPAASGADNEYWLYTRHNPTSKQILKYNDLESVKNSYYRSDLGTVVLAHGWSATGHTEVNVAITSAFLAVMDVNIIVLDYHKIAELDYLQAAAGTPDVGNYLGDFLIWLFQDAGGNWDQVHLIGYSLGAHIIAVAGRRTGSQAARVTGLDPAGPSFGSFQGQHRYRLRSDAGRHVEVIHTDGRLLGIMDRSGDADFYPNGGAHPQPGCDDGILGSGCSHGRAHEFFTSSILTHDRFVGRQCNNLWEAQLNRCAGAELHMGNGFFNKTGSGIFGLKTGASWPF